MVLFFTLTPRGAEVMALVGTHKFLLGVTKPLTKYVCERFFPTTVPCFLRKPDYGLLDGEESDRTAHTSVTHYDDFAITVKRNRTVGPTFSLRSNMQI